MTAIRTAVTLLGVCVITFVDIAPSFAVTYRPWCVVYIGRGGRSCAFTSFEQCMMTAGPGTGGSCEQNPWYLWYGEHGERDPGTTGQGERARR
jgi:hypothetical protein